MYKIAPIILFSIICHSTNYGQNAKTFPTKGAPRNVILITVNGMGMNQIAAAALKKGTMLSFGNFPVTGFTQPWLPNGQPPSNYVTASAIGTNKFQNQDKNAKTKTIFDLGKDENIETGLISTASVTDLTPKTFVFDDTYKKDNEAIALDYVNYGLNVIIGGGSKYFEKRYDGRNLLKEMKKKGYNIESKLSGLNNPSPIKTVALLEKEGIYRASERKDFLTKATLFATRSMSSEPGGYLLVIDDSKIEEADSLNNTPLLIEEMLDLDKLVATLSEQAGSETLILITGNYERGGLELLDGKVNPKSDPDVAWHSKNPTPALAPVFAKGPGADQFSGIYTQSDIYKKLAALITSRH
jgi:alkaline phosphatase